jgi:hypothetical protein
MHQPRPQPTSYCTADSVAFYEQATLGNEDAWRFLVAYHDQAHRVDDQMDTETSREQQLFTIKCEQALWANPFYRQHEQALGLVSSLVHSSYANSVIWERAETERAKAVADVLRFCGNLMVEAVAHICGGYEHARKISALLWAMSWFSHHDADGKGI